MPSRLRYATKIPTPKSERKELNTRDDSLQKLSGEHNDGHDDQVDESRTGELFAGMEVYYSSIDRDVISKIRYGSEVWGSLCA